MKVTKGASAKSRPWLFVLATTYATVATAAVEFEPAISLGVAHTDNVALVPEDAQRATVYQFFPSFTLAQDAERIDTELDLRVEAYRYDELQESDVYQNVDAAVVVALDPDNFFLEFGATRGQTIRDPEATIPLTNFGLNANRVDRDDVYAGPSFRYLFGDNGTARGSFRRDRVRYDDAAFPEVDADTFQFSVDNYRQEQGVAWGFRYAADETDFGGLEPWEYRQAGLELGGWVTPGLRIFASVGRESPWDDPGEASLEDDYWEIGFAHSAGAIALELAAGDRSYGWSRRGSLEASFGRTRTAFRYSERPATQGLHYYRDLIVSGGEFDFLDRPAAAERYISKLFSWRWDLSLNRTTISASLSEESREQRVSLEGVPLEDEEQSYLDLSAGWRAGAKTDFSLGTQKARRRFGATEYFLRSYYFSAERQLGQRTSLSGSLTRTKGESMSASAYRFDMVTVLLTRSF